MRERKGGCRWPITVGVESPPTSGHTDIRKGVGRELRLWHRNETAPRQCDDAARLKVARRRMKRRNPVGASQNRALKIGRPAKLGYGAKLNVAGTEGGLLSSLVTNSQLYFSDCNYFLIRPRRLTSLKFPQTNRGDAYYFQGMDHSSSSGSDSRSVSLFARP